MFEKFKKFMKKISQGFLYECSFKTLIDFMNYEFNFAMEIELELASDIYIHYNDKIHRLLVSTPFCDGGVSVTLDDVEYGSISNFENSAQIDGVLLSSIEGNLIIEIDGDNIFLEENAKRINK